MKKLVATLRLVVLTGTLVIPATSHASGFLTGFIFGQATSGGNSSTRVQQSTLSGIPFRCFTALEESDDAYRNCRRPSMRRELSDVSRLWLDGSPLCVWKGGEILAFQDYPKADCDPELAITLELKALHALADAQKAVDNAK